MPIGYRYIDRRTSRQVPLGEIDRLAAEVDPDLGESVCSEVGTAILMHEDAFRIEKWWPQRALWVLRQADSQENVDLQARIVRVTDHIFSRFIFEAWRY